MFGALNGRNFLSMADLTPEELRTVLKTARQLKLDTTDRPHLHRKGLAMIFQKPSLRTRVSFERGMAELGGQAIYLAPSDISLGKRETTEDIALVLSRFYQLIMARVFGHDIVEDLAKYATVPVINGLSDHEHPCQALADYMTIQERKGEDLTGLTLSYIGDGNNVAHSLMLGGALLGVNVNVVCPLLHEPDENVLARSRELAGDSGATIEVSNDMEAITGSDVLYTDVWTSMGQEKEANRRRELFQGYCIDAKAMEKAKDDAVILHCLPAHYGEEIDYETSRLPNSAIFDQAENRMHAQKALMVHLAG